jgi:hypothetical protein
LIPAAGIARPLGTVDSYKEQGDSDVREKPILGETYRHVARGKTYSIVGVVYASMLDKFDGETYWLLAQQLKSTQKFSLVNATTAGLAKDAIFRLPITMQRSVFNPDQRAAEVVIYQCREDNSVWGRPISEFMDGRFERAGP